MKHTELNREFVLVEKKEEIDIEFHRYWGRNLGGWLTWDDLLEKKRVILLAEASSGKTDEFKKITEKLQQLEKAAFFVPIEELADESFENSLNPHEIEIFNKWENSDEEGFFFLDSIDEARLNSKKFDQSLKKLAKTIFNALGRSRIFISCRVSDWKGHEDEHTVERLLPLPIDSIDQDIKEYKDPETALLEPLFKKPETNEKEETTDQKNVSLLTIIRLIPLDIQRQELLAKSAGVEDAAKFSQAIWQNGLENLAERPGDLIELAEFWKANKKFASLSEMVSYGVDQKLSEIELYRPDSNLLSPNKARKGAEKIAAALTLGKIFTVRVPSQKAYPKLSTEALDTKKILKDWSDSERAALLRRGIFTPATYGRIRFHHRSTQEYLTAKWFKSLLQNGCSKSGINKILFADKYNIKTVVPSLRPVAAWLSIDSNEIMEEILCRDPLILLQHGDPGSLPIETRRKILKLYALKHQAGDISNDSIDHRSLWMFAHQDIEDTIHEVWDTCNRYDFKGDLLRLIREGSLCGCEDILSSIAFDKKSRDYHRTVAVQALNNCKSCDLLSKFTDALVKKADKVSAKTASLFASELFPEHINLDQLIILIKKTNPPAKGSVTGFGYHLNELWEKCPPEWQKKFSQHLAALSLSEPFVSDHERISKKYRFLTKNLKPIAKSLISKLSNRKPSLELVRILMAIERERDTYSYQKDVPPLSEIVNSKQKIKQMLFWADVTETCQYDNKINPNTQYWHVSIGLNELWSLGTKDIDWLYADLRNKTLIKDKRIALSAIASILLAENSLETNLKKIKKAIKFNSTLKEDLNEYIKPPKELPWQKEERLRAQKRKKEKKQKDAEIKASWTKFRDDLIKDPSILKNTDSRLSSIRSLTHWLRRKTGLGRKKAACQWQLLETAFNRDVAIAYRDSLKDIWRGTIPKRPRRKDSQITTKWNNLYAYIGLFVESNSDSNWAKDFTTQEVEFAVKHGCFTESGYPEWLDELTNTYPQIAIPIIDKSFRIEFKWKEEFGPTDLINRYSYPEYELNPKIESTLFEIIIRANPSKLKSTRLQQGLDILTRMKLSNKKGARLTKYANKWFEYFLEKNEEKIVLTYLSLLFFIDSISAFQCLKKWIEKTVKEERENICIKIFSGIFDNDRRTSFYTDLSALPNDVLKGLISVVYKYVHPNNDDIHEGSFTPTMRDHAGSGRSSLLSALSNKKGAPAYYDMVELAKRKEIGNRAHRFYQIARGMAERDSERPPWKEEEFFDFEKNNNTPIKTGGDLYSLSKIVLEDIKENLQKGDASSKGLLKKLREIDRDDEDSVQNWLAEQLIFRSKERYHTHRESEVAEKDRPDIIISATTALVEVAIEVKQADSWSPNELKKALTKQLSEDYLKPQTRRHGILFMLDNGRRKWKYPGTNKPMFFEDIIRWLKNIANDIDTNSSGHIGVSVFGIKI